MKVKLYEGGIMPQRAHFDDAGIDLFTPEDFTIEPNDSAVIDTKVAVQIPVGYFGKLESKSGLNVNHSVVSLGGTIDSSYRGTIKAKIYNFGKETAIFKRGNKIVQMVLIPVGLFDLEQVDELDPDVSGRGVKGFGSTGK